MPQGKPRQEGYFRVVVAFQEVMVIFLQIKGLVYQLTVFNKNPEKER